MIRDQTRALYKIWTDVRLLRFTGADDEAVAEELGMDVAEIGRLTWYARAMGWAVDGRPRRKTVCHVAGAAGDDRRDQLCSRCDRVLRLRRFGHVADQFFSLGAVVYELDGRLTPGRPSHIEERPCRQIRRQL